MENWKQIAVLVAVSSLALTACGGDGGSKNASTGTSKGLDCRTVNVIVPYSPGGGSDQQVRRLQKALEATLETKLTITYQTGGDGSVGWNAAANAAPDGCTIANVVLPNIAILSDTAGGDVGFKADDFEYIAWTEYSPNMVLVGTKSKFKTIQEFIAAAKAQPGKVTMNGVGSTGALLAGEVMKATGTKFVYVPITGGVGDMIPQIAGGHVDSGIAPSSGLEGGQLHPLALSVASDKFGNVPTFEEAGYPGVKLTTAWGFILPPKTPKDIVSTWNAAVQKALNDPKVKEAYAKTMFTVLNQNVDEAQKYFKEQQLATRSALKAVG